MAGQKISAQTASDIVENDLIPKEVHILVDIQIQVHWSNKKEHL